MTEDEKIEALSRRVVTIKLDRADLARLLEGLDSYVYWQLSDEHYRNNGFVNSPWSDDPEARAEIERVNSLHENLEIVFMRTGADGWKTFPPKGAYEVGASTFSEFHKGETMKETFVDAVQHSKHENGHGGYTGTLAEKRECRYITEVETLDEATKLADKLIDAGDPRIDDKWGPAGAIKVKVPEAGWLFFGWASS